MPLPASAIGAQQGGMGHILTLVGHVPSQDIHLPEGVVQDSAVSLEFKVPLEQLLLEQEREPELVVRPHVAERDLVLVEPLGPHLCGKKGYVNTLGLCWAVLGGDRY